MHTSKLTSNFLTLDLEEWYDAELPKRKLRDRFDKNSKLDFQVNLFLDLCARNDVKATIFVVGRVAQENKSLIKRISDEGHEVASHSFDHGLVYNKDRNSFINDLQKSVGVLEGITGKKVYGFRAPSWSVNREVSEWYYDCLKQESLIYSSSVFPGKTFLYGYPEAEENIHKVHQGIVEIPQQLVSFGGKKLGFSGGFYLRVLPGFLIKKFIKKKNDAGNPVFIYTHPWELSKERLDVELSNFERVLQFYGVKSNIEKIDSIVKDYSSSFSLMKDFALASFNRDS